MDYPRIDRRALSTEGKRFFRCWYSEFKNSIAFDVKENGLRLSRQDVRLLAWNCTAFLVSSHERKLRLKIGERKVG